MPILKELINLNWLSLIKPYVYSENQQNVDNFAFKSANATSISFPILYICVLDKKYIFRVNFYERRNQEEQLFGG